MAAGSNSKEILESTLEKERRNLAGSLRLKSTLLQSKHSTLNDDNLHSVELEIKQNRNRLDFLENQLNQLGSNTVNTHITAMESSDSIDAGAPLSPFDYLKHESALTTNKIAFKLEGVRKKLATEVMNKTKAEQHHQALKGDPNADPTALTDAQLADLEANARVACLMRSEVRWQQLFVPTTPNLSLLESIDSAATMTKRPMSGHLKLRIITAANLPNKQDSPTYTVIRIDGSERARTKPSQTSWNQDFDIEVSKAEEFEMTVYSNDGLLLSLVWLRLGDLADALAAQEPHAEASIGSWVGSAFGFHRNGGLETWLDLEPAGQVLAKFQFIEDKYDVQPESGFLVRKKAVKKGVAVRGHKFIKSPRGVTNRCVVCEKLMLVGLTCEYCKYSVHKECSEKSLTCSVKGDTEEQESEDDRRVAKHLSKHRIVHRFANATAPIAPPWCRQCGQVIPPLSQIRKCTACDNFSVHIACEKLVPHFCGMSAKNADEFMREAEKIEEKKRRELLEIEEKKRLTSAEEVRKSLMLSRGEDPSLDTSADGPSPTAPILPGRVGGRLTGPRPMIVTSPEPADTEDVYQQALEALAQRSRERDEFEAKMSQLAVTPTSSTGSLSPTSSLSALPDPALYDEVSEVLAARERERASFESRRASLLPPPIQQQSISNSAMPRVASNASIRSNKSPLLANAPPRTVSRQASSEIPAFPAAPVYPSPQSLSQAASSQQQRQPKSDAIDLNDPEFIREQQAAFQAIQRSRTQAPDEAGPPRTASLINHRPVSFAQAASGVLTPDQINAFIAEQRRLYIQAQSAQTQRNVSPAASSSSSSLTAVNTIPDDGSADLQKLSEEQVDYEDELDEEDALLRQEEEEEFRLREQEERRRREELDRHNNAEENERRAREQEEISRRSMLQETAQQRIRELILAQQVATQQRIQMEARLREAATRRDQEVRMREEISQRELQQATLARAQQQALAEQARREEYERAVRAQQVQEQVMRQQEYMAAVQRHQQVMYNQQMAAMQEQQRRQMVAQQQAQAAAYMQQQQALHAEQQQRRMNGSNGALNGGAVQQQQQQPLRSLTGRRKMSQKKNVTLNDFSLIAVLGKGAFGKVLLVEDRRTKELFALKSLKKDHALENNDIESIRSELTVFRLASGSRFPFLVNLYACFQTPERLNFVMEYAAGGDLMMHLSKNGRFPRNTDGIKFYAAELLLALEFLHQNSIVYRDLKPENVLLSPEGHIKLADYGVCKENIGYGSTTRTFCGTLDTMAPEILTGSKYTRAVDWWSYGIMLYVFVFRSYPYKGNKEEDYLKEISTKPLRFPVEPDADLKDLILKLLVVNPTRRLGSGRRDADEIKMHPWFFKVDWNALLSMRVPPPFVPSRKNAYDTSNFDGEFTRETPMFTQMRGRLSNKEQGEFGGFEYICGDWGSQVSQQQLLHYTAGSNMLR
ncbi:hypothetical protein SmJEL517_g04587 [Synchytrium microbalum]|uniref:protein kinase C n=1 Tax=Synchytrium microbalum TaxID=1806994 RepID=A0A507BZK1_9FUNG|nr:uncharacterized protein SmJEL517_g04587 [Synchytrium microbalum]TPX32289.1 hypothetical protein SmJEL517_g04587 [Synchytrium microbalum]